MGDWFQVIVDRDAAATEAEPLAVRVRDRLFSDGIVLPDTTDCVLGAAWGYPPGPRYQQATIEPANLTLVLRTNGLDVVTTRTVFHSGQGENEIICPRCGAAIRGADARRVFDAVGDWHDGGRGLYACSACGHTDSITELLWEPAWGFGHLGFRFWNWPRLNAAFVAEITRLLAHRTVLVTGKL